MVSFPESYMTHKDLIKYYVNEIEKGFPSQIGYHAQQLKRLLPTRVVERIVSDRLDDIAGLNDFEG